MLNYHLDHEKEEIFIFFDHYYDNQWLDHEHKPDEVVNRVIRQQGQVVGVMGKQYRRSGHLMYCGMYKNGKFDGHGTYYTETQDCYDGSFQKGERVGEFKVFNERSLLRVEHYSGGALNGEVIEYYSNGEIHSTTIYQNNKKNGPSQIRDGTGALIFWGRYVNDSRAGEGYEFLGANLAYEGQYKDGKFVRGKLVYVPTKINLNDPTKHIFDDDYYQLKSKIPLIGDWIDAFNQAKPDYENNVCGFCIRFSLS